MRNTKKYIFSIIVVIVLAGIGYAFYIWNKPARNVSDEEGVKITAAALFDSFNTNEQSANNHYLNKAIEVTGKVTTVKKNQAGETVVYLQSSDAVFGVNCTFKKDPGNIEKESNITFKGVCTGYLSDVVLNEGVLVK